MTPIQATLCFLVRGNEVLLGLKKTGLGKGKWNGIGGKIEPGETPAQAIAREVKEEIKVTLKKFEQRAFIKFYNVLMHDGTRSDLNAYVFLATEWDGEAQETDEMLPRWFSKDTIPFHAMWIDDPYWLPQFLQGARVRAEFWFEGDNKIAKHSVVAV